MPDFYADSHTPWELLAKHLAGDASGAEQAELHDWLQENPARLRQLTDATRTWERGGKLPEVFTEADVSRAWARFSAAAELPQKATPAPAPTGRVVGLWARAPWLRAAAAVLLLVGFWALARTWLTPVGSASQAAEMVAVTAGAIQQQATLPDGSKVWLNRNSTLRYAANFAGDKRQVELDGEAFFEVRKDPSRPFTVLARDTRTRVLGTSFNVRAYAAEDSVEVAVVTGRVSFAPNHQAAARQDSVVLMPGQRGVLQHAQPAVAVSQPIHDPNFRAWQQQELVFENETLADVTTMLSRYYNTPVALSRPELARCRFTGTFTRTNLPQVLRVVSVSAGLTISQNPDGYLLDGPGCE